MLNDGWWMARNRHPRPRLFVPWSSHKAIPGIYPVEFHGFPIPQFNGQLSKFSPWHIILAHKFQVLLASESSDHYYRCSFCTVGESRYRFQRWLQIPICCGCIGRSPYVWWVKMVGKNCPMSPMLAREMAEKRSDSAYPKSPQVAGIIIEGLPF